MERRRGRGRFHVEEEKKMTGKRRKQSGSGRQQSRSGGRGLAVTEDAKGEGRPRRRAHLGGGARLASV